MTLNALEIYKALRAAADDARRAAKRSTLPKEIFTYHRIATQLKTHSLYFGDLADGGEEVGDLSKVLLTLAELQDQLTHPEDWS